MKTKKIKIKFITPLLGSASGNPDLHRDYIASKAPDAPSREEEIAALGVDEVERKEMTVFARTPDGKPCLWDYQIKGFFKNACQTLRAIDGTASSKIKAYKKYIDGLVFVSPRQIPIEYDGEILDRPRSLRASTPQGERIALANSERIGADEINENGIGAEIEVEIAVLKDELWNTVKEWLDYGSLNGIGQWHNGGYGRFVWEEKDG